MSHFTELHTTISSSRKNALKKALLAIGVPENRITISDTPMDMTNYYGQKHNRKCHVKVSGGLNYGKADLGFEFMPNGTAVLHGDNMGLANWQDRLMQQYSRAVIKEVASEQGFYLEEEKTDNKTGELVMVVNSQW